MPRYDLICKGCGIGVEHKTDKVLTQLPWCPQCGVEMQIKVKEPPAVHFKGPGFYKTDNSKKGV